MEDNNTDNNIPTDKLTIGQLRWIANRAWHNTDVECQEALGMGDSCATKWRRDPHFAEAERSIFTGDIKRSQETMARLRDRAVLVLESLLSSRDPRVCRAAAADVLDRSGMSRGEVVTVQISGVLAELLAESETPSEDAA